MHHALILGPLHTHHLSLSLQKFVHLPYAGSRTLAGIIFRLDGLDTRSIYSVAGYRVGNDMPHTEAEAGIEVGHLLWEIEMAIVPPAKLKYHDRAPSKSSRWSECWSFDC